MPDCRFKCRKYFHGQCDIRLLQTRPYVSLPGSSLFVFFILGDAQNVTVFEPVVVLWLLSAGWRCVLDPAYWDVRQGSAGVRSRPGSRGTDNRRNQPVKWYNTLLGPGLDWPGGRRKKEEKKNTEKRIFCHLPGCCRCRSCLFNYGLNHLSDDGWRAAGDNLIKGREW